MNQKQTDITTGKQIRHLRTQSGMTQEELAGKLNVTRQALSNWERDVNEPDLNTLKKICFLFGVHMDDFAKEVITKMETCEKKRNDNLISMIWQLDSDSRIRIFINTHRTVQLCLGKHNVKETAQLNGGVVKTNPNT